MRTAIEVITPDVAAEYLTHNKKENRTVSKKLVHSYARDMKAGKWTLTHQGISFDVDGGLSDGQHRLFACVEAGVPFTTMVSYGVPISANIDRCRTRSFRDSVITGGLADAGDVYTDGKIIATANFALEFPNIKSCKKTISQTMDYMRAHENSLIFLKQITTANRLLKGTRSAPVLFSIMAAYEDGVDPEVLREWYKVLNTGIYDEVTFRKKEAARGIVSLRNGYFIQKQGAVALDFATRLETVKKCESSINHYNKNEYVSRVYGEIVYPNLNVEEECNG